MTIQAELAARFVEGDREAGAPFLALVLMEEVGELAEALRRKDLEEARKEVADVVFIALSMASVLGADVEALLRAKFLARPKEDVTASWTDVPDAGRDA